MYPHPIPHDLYKVFVRRWHIRHDNHGVTFVLVAPSTHHKGMTLCFISVVYGVSTKITRNYRHNTILECVPIFQSRIRIGTIKESTEQKS